MTPRRSELGFTLVEMVVALLIFAVLAGAGVGLLRASVDTQEVVGKALADLGEAARLRSLLQGDLGQALVRPLADAPTGFAGRADGMTLVRAYEPAERSAGSIDVQAVRWSLAGGALVRQTVDPDGATAGPPATLARDVAAIALRYRAPDGTWRGTWPGSASDPPLPTAVEVRIEQQGKAPITLLVALPPVPPPPPPPAPAPGQPA
ncbi:GspJ family type II secretion system protein [Sphingomonas sp. LHG3406-1]|uniref:GspJ family type II secretion system protein n=1 Tax=Sphingomonas sp. LHG3406-1 TaxID=2804617 RepID=UPI002631C55F|nr:GspJ family type II secretion system protein [Sphingomonas sp. LHG3406-1]